MMTLIIYGQTLMHVQNAEPSVDVDVMTALQAKEDTQDTLMDAIKARITKYKEITK